jgi:hypothetical protein
LPKILGYFRNLKKLPKENNLPKGENSSNLVTLTRNKFKVPFNPKKVQLSILARAEPTPIKQFKCALFEKRSQKSQLNTK